MNIQDTIEEIRDEVFDIMASSFNNKTKAQKIIPVLNRFEEIGL